MNLNTKNYQEMIAFMDKHEDFNQMLIGKNEDGEMACVSISEDNIMISTHQKNGWVRENVYWRDGTVEEFFNGKWM